MTLQQETGKRIYDADDHGNKLEFNEWYQFWCAENGLFYDGRVDERAEGIE